MAAVQHQQVGGSQRWRWQQRQRQQQRYRQRQRKQQRQRQQQQQQRQRRWRWQQRAAEAAGRRQPSSGVGVSMAYCLVWDSSQLAGAGDAGRTGAPGAAHRAKGCETAGGVRRHCGYSWPQARGCEIATTHLPCIRVRAAATHDAHPGSTHLPGSSHRRPHRC